MAGQNGVAPAAYLELLCLNWREAEAQVVESGSTALDSFPVGWLPVKSVVAAGLAVTQVSDWIERGWLHHVQAEIDGQGYKATIVHGTTLLRLSWLLLTDTGCAIVKTRLADNSAAIPNTNRADGREPAPQWDRRTRTLSLGSIVVRRFGRIAPCQFQVLDAFEAAGWPTEMVAPKQVECENPVERLKSAMRELNNNQYGKKQIRFGTAELGSHATWRLEER